ncbi:MAG: AAA family ATPase, partial [Nitrososphaeria archaeon]
IIKSSRKIEDVLPEAEHYKDSYVFKEYQVNGSSITDLSGNPINDDQLLNDLKTILNQYVNDVLYGLQSTPPGTVMPEPEERLLFETIREELYLSEDFDLDALITAVKNGNVLLYGPPGTGKTTYAKFVATSISGGNFMIRTANSLWFRREVIGGETIEGGTVKWKSGFLIEAYNRASDLGDDQLMFVILDELNRADADKAFGDFFTIFSSNDHDEWQVPEDLANEIATYGENADDSGKTFVKKYRALKRIGTQNAPLKRIRIIATVNLADINNLYLLGEALLRRFMLIEFPCPGSDKKEKCKGYEGEKTKVEGLEQMRELVKKETESILGKRKLNLNDSVKNLLIECVSNIRCMFLSYYYEKDEDKRTLADFCLSPSTLERAAMILADGVDHSADDVIKAIKMALGTLDRKILNEIDEVKSRCQLRSQTGTQS